ncbi:MAG TPA: glycoside hydrolase family 16 protein [Trebonia sp.]|jgi:hypothetical protein|nr:glycoside hydrolase family 16 protein [Trebonia sp.]
MRGWRGSAARSLACLAAAGLATLCACGTTSGATPAAGGGSPSLSSSPAASAPASPSPSPSSSASSSRPAARAVEAAGSPLWQLKWSTNFPQGAALGDFSGCNNYDRTPAAYCSGLPRDLQSQWWAYPNGWPDSATEVNMKLGGYYDPSHTIWISDGQMHIRLFRSTGAIHSAAVVPKAAIGLKYAKYVERFRVSDPESSTGYKSSHLLWPTNEPLKYEVDYPEGEWDSGFCVHVHSVSQGNATKNICPPGTSFSTWNTTEVEWWPGHLAFYLNGTEVYRLTGKWVPDEPMSWIIQNETALNGEIAPENSSAQLNISYVAVYTYAGKKS